MIRFMLDEGKRIGKIYLKVFVGACVLMVIVVVADMLWRMF